MGPVTRLWEHDHAETGNARVIVFDGAGHVSTLDRPDVSSSEVENFVEPLAAADTTAP